MHISCRTVLSLSLFIASPSFFNKKSKPDFLISFKGSGHSILEIKKHVSGKNWGYQEALSQMLVYSHLDGRCKNFICFIFDEISAGSLTDREKGFLDKFIGNFGIYYVVFHVKHGLIEHNITGRWERL